MKIYVVTAIHDPKCHESSYVIGTYSSKVKAILEILTWASARKTISLVEAYKEEWGDRYLFFDSDCGVNFGVDIEQTTLDETTIVV